MLCAAGTRNINPVTLHEKRRPKSHYTQAQKEKAVRYYVEHRISITQAWRKMGYPHRVMLRAWIQEIRPNLFNKNKRLAKKNYHLIRYTKEEKYAIVEEWMTSNIPVYPIAAKYGISKVVISKWKCEILGKDSKMQLQKDEEYWLPKETKQSLQSEIVRLQAEIHMPRMERDTLQKASELLKKVKGINLKKLKNRWKDILIHALREHYRLKEPLSLLCISKSSYCYQVKCRCRNKYGALREKARHLFYSSNRCYGYRRIYQILKKEGTTEHLLLLRWQTRWKATVTLKENEYPILHSDRGDHYGWPGWVERIERAGLRRSMSRKGCSPDCEGFFGRLKVERFYDRNWKHASIDEFISILDSYIHWYNTKRIKQSLVRLNPLEYRV